MLAIVKWSIFNRCFRAALVLATILLRFSRVSAFPLAAPSWPGELEFLVSPPAPDVAPALRLEAEWPAWFQVSGRASAPAVALPASLVADAPPVLMAECGARRAQERAASAPPVLMAECRARRAQERAASALPAQQA
jgi:hypothetical protein